MENLFEVAYQCICEKDPKKKSKLTRFYTKQWRNGELVFQPSDLPVKTIEKPGRPAKPELVQPTKVARRRVGDKEGLASLIHAIAHIEFNAINLAWDAVYRFREMPQAFFDDWVKVADEEAYHYTLLTDRLAELGYGYGDFTAHDGLWDMARRTDHDVLVRMALVPRVMEARGLDATPKIVSRLRSINDEATIALLDIIMRDEIGHVEIGTRWFNFCCQLANVEPESTFKDLLFQYGKGRIKSPLHLEARRKAGFTESELSLLQSLAD